MAGKKYREAAAQVEEGRVYSIDEAVELTKKVAFAKFDETVEVGMTLGVDPRKADQLVRGTVVLPHGLGKSKRVVVICSAFRRVDRDARHDAICRAARQDPRASRAYAESEDRNSYSRRRARRARDQGR